MQKLLIADSSACFTSMLVDLLESQFEVCTCADGEEALEVLPRYRPDILILNLMLPYVDGLTVLQKTTFRPGLILATTVHVSDYVEQALHTLNVDYTMISPTPNAVVARLWDLLRCQHTNWDAVTDLQTRTVHHLRLLKMPAHLDGYRQFCLAMPMFVQDPQLLLTKELYPAVAKACGCQDGRAVEHSLRKAIHAAWKNRDHTIWHRYFPGCNLQCPTNKAFLCRLAEILDSETGLMKVE